MKAVFFNPENGELFTRIVPVPVPGKGEVLIQMIAAPVNPSDLAKIRETTAAEAVDFIPGIEGCGKVVAAGKGILPALFMGRRVACSSKLRHSGTWAEYMVTAAGNCFPVSNKIPDVQASMTIVNPMTALAFLDIAKSGNHKAVVLSAAASALGGMITPLFTQSQIKTLNLVRNEAGVAELMKRGCKDFLNTSADDFHVRFMEWCLDNKPSLMFDATGGELVNDILDHLPANSTIVLYGNLSQQKIEFLPTQLLRDNKKMTGFFLGHWIAEKGLLKTIRTLLRVNRLLKGGMKTKVQATMPLEEIRKAVELYEHNMGKGKVILTMWDVPDSNQ
jgi:NADPH:quinone reductase